MEIQSLGTKSISINITFVKPFSLIIFLQGVPIRIELGPKDIEKKQLVAVRRDTGEKLTIPLKDAVNEIEKLLKTIQEALYSK